MNEYLVVAVLVLSVIGALIALLPSVRRRIKAEFSHNDRKNGLIGVISFSGGVLTLSRISGGEQSIEFYAVASLGFFLVYSGLGILALMLVASISKED